jgi:hypothetical protein
VSEHEVDMIVARLRIVGPVFELEEFMSRRARRPTAFVSPVSNARSTSQMLEQDDVSEYVIAT